MIFPKTVIIAIDSHGFYSVKDNKISDFINISDINTNTNTNTNSCIKNIYKINAVFPGVKNVSTKKIHNKTMKKILSFIQNPNIEQLYLNEDTLNNFIIQLRDILIECNNELIPILQKDISSIKKSNVNPDIFPNYLHHYDKSFSIEKNILLEKNYMRFQPDEKYKDKLLVMNPNEGPELDLFMLMKALMDVDMDTFCLSDVIQMFDSLFVENIVILDFSCSDFKDVNTMKEVSNRITRYIRRNLIK